MIWFKSVFIGFAAAFVTLVAVLVVMFASIDVPEGALVVSISILSVPVLLPTIIGFALGFWWSMRRARRKRALPDV
jgi:ABC-type Fe3+ transport system permease subunit